MSLQRALSFLCAAFLLASCEQGQARSKTIFELGEPLLEISGLAVAGPYSVFAHNDEHAIIYEISVDDGRIIRAFALDEPTMEGDFEGIATDGKRVFVVTSDGLIYSAVPGEDRERVSYRVYDSGIGPRCEVEGLSKAPTPGELLILCKRMRNDKKKLQLEIYRWKIGEERAEEEPFLSFPLRKLLSKRDRKEFRPSALEWDSSAGQLLVVSARNRMMLTFDANGRLIERQRLKRSRHQQTEGIAIMPDGRLVLADEGTETSTGRITVYKNY